MKVIRDERTGTMPGGVPRPSRYLRGWIGERYVLAPIPGTEDHRLLTEATEVMR